MFDPREIKKRESGKRVFIVASGPSILKQDLSFLLDEIVIGMNGTPFIEEKFGFKSDYYTVSDIRFLQDNNKYNSATKNLHKDTIRVFREELSCIDSRAYFKNTCYLKAIARDGFSFDLRKGFYFGCTTTLLSVQLAYYLGAKEIILLGCDLFYSAKQPRVYKEKAPAPIDNFTGIQVYNLRNAFLKLGERGIPLYNASPVSLLRPYLPFYSLP